MHELVPGRKWLELDHVPVSGPPGCCIFHFALADFIALSRSQMDFAWRCMFPRYSDWDIAFTPNGLLRQQFKHVLRYIIPTCVAIAIAWARMNGVGPKEGARILLLTLADALS